MENTWLSLGLRRYSDLPLNRGWVNTFRRWVDTAAFQRLWPTLRPEYGTDFCRFCEEQLHLTTKKPAVVQIDDPAEQAFESPAIKLLGEEYRREWPCDPAPQPGRSAHGGEGVAARQARPAACLVDRSGPTPPLPAAGTSQPPARSSSPGSSWPPIMRIWRLTFRDWSCLPREGGTGATSSWSSGSAGLSVYIAGLAQRSRGARDKLAGHARRHERQTADALGQVSQAGRVRRK